MNDCDSLMPMSQYALADLTIASDKSKEGKRRVAIGTTNMVKYVPNESGVRRGQEML